MAAAKNSSLTLCRRLLRQVRPLFMSRPSSCSALSQSCLPGVLMPAGAPQSASAVLAVAVGHGGDCLTRLELWPGEH